MIALQLDISETLNRRELARLIADMSPDDRVDLIKHIPEERRERILPGFGRSEAAARLKLDPAVVASPALTKLVDITGLLIFFSTATWLLRI